MSPLAISHHWRAGNWNEVHPGLTLECRKGRIGLAAGQMRNSVNRDLRFASLSMVFPLTNIIGLRAGLIVGEYERRYDSVGFAAPLLAVTIADGQRIAFDVMHMPVGEAPATAIGIRIKIN